VAKCELNTWEWENSKVTCATLSIPYDSTKLMQGTQYPTSNLVMSQVYQMITKLEMSTMTYVHTSLKESFIIDEAVQKAVRPDMMKHILKARTQMVESMYKYFDSDLSESHRAKLHIFTQRYSTQGSSTTTGVQYASTCRMPLLCTVCV
jgi:hypothetical protein